MRMPTPGEVWVWEAVPPELLYQLVLHVDEREGLVTYIVMDSTYLSDSFPDWTVLQCGVSELGELVEDFFESEQA